jgi:beta-galactosidase
VANSGGWGGTSTVIDLVGYNYINQSNPDDQHAKFPHQPGVGTEEATTPGTRGIYSDVPPRAHLGFKALGDTGGNCEKGWKYYAGRPFLAGLFFWTGFDYRGEPMPYGWPEIYAQFGFLDGCGFPKDTAYYLKSWWTDQPVLHLYPHWNWPGKEGQPIDVVCFSNHEAVELFLNGVTLGKKDMPRNGHLEWKVAYAPGALEARGYRGGQVVATTRVETTGAPAQLVLTPDRAVINSDGADVAVFTVSAHDAQGRTVPTAANVVNFEIKGGRIIGVGNGDPGCHEPDRFIETVAMLPVEEWRGRIAPAGTAAPAAPESLQPFPTLGNWKAPLPKPGEVYDLSGAIALKTVPADADLRLILPTFGGKTTLWLNGRELAHALDTSAAGPALPLDPALLVAGLNRVQLIATPFDDKKNHIPELTRLGSVRITTPAQPARRSLFNGLAQVIVQSTKEPGEIRLTAKSDGLTAAESTVSVRGAAAP